MKFSEVVAINSRFRRSINIEQDLADKDILEGFLCPASSEHAMLNVSHNVFTTGQSAFTWTGPYGSGKSSLVLLLSALVGKNTDLRHIAEKSISKHTSSTLIKQLHVSAGWNILPIVGEPKDPLRVFRRELLRWGHRSLGNDTKEEIIELLLAISRKDDGLIIFVDEMGKFLEFAGRGEGDIYFFQQLAELASRSKGRLILIGVLHQSFAEYARYLPHTTRDEWMKIQGRFVDMPVSAAGEEQIDLIGRAIISSKKPHAISKAVDDIVKNIALNRPVEEVSLKTSLASCWPLNPIVACLIGPVSRRKFGQNQRSIFSFLNSAEPKGFKEFISLMDFATDTYYMPHMYFDYLRYNLEPQIMASSDSKLWSIAVDAISRCEARGLSSKHIEILKTIALIDIFKGTSGLTASDRVLSTIYPDNNNLVKDLIKASVIIFKKHTNSYSIFEGSDFDIDAAIKEAISKINHIDIAKLSKIANFKPIIAKRHYHKNGAMRWFNVAIAPMDEIINFIEAERNSGAAGLFAVLIPSTSDETNSGRSFVKAYTSDKAFPVFFALAKESFLINEYARDLLALEWISSNRSELAGDSVARREIDARMTFIISLLETKLSEILTASHWYHDGTDLGILSDVDLSVLASDYADNIYLSSPLIKTELLNRKKASGSANTALNSLLRAMLAKTGEPRLGITGFPPEGGLFKILLEDTKLYIEDKDGRFQFVEPSKNSPANLYMLWHQTDVMLKKFGDQKSVEQIYDFWAAAPFGVKRALAPFLMVTYLLTRPSTIAIYRDNVYTTRIDDLLVDYVLKAPQTITLRWAELGTVSHDILFGLTQIANKLVPSHPLQNNVSPLEVGRHIVAIVDGLHPWVKKTKTLSKTATKFREIVKNASDPNKMLFDDFPALFTRDLLDEQQRVQMILTGFEESLSELIGLYPQTMAHIGQLLTTELEVGLPTPGNLQRLNARARNVQGISGDLRVDAFAARLITFAATLDDIAGIISLANNKPPASWIDIDMESAQQQIITLCMAFRKSEIYARIKNRKPSRHSIAFITATGGGTRTYEAEFDVLAEKQCEIDSLKGKITTFASKLSSDRKLVLAALAAYGIDLAQQLQERKHNN